MLEFVHTHLKNFNRLKPFEGYDKNGLINEASLNKHSLLSFEKLLSLNTELYLNQTIWKIDYDAYIKK